MLLSLRRFWCEDRSKSFSISLICISTFDGVCWTRRWQRRTRLLLDRKMIATKSENLHSKLIISRANDGESSQNWSNADQTGFCVHQHALRFLTELFCVGVNNWVKELAASDVIEVEREKVRSFWSRLGIQHTNAPSNRWKLIQPPRAHENCDKLKWHASIKDIHEVSLLGRDSCYWCCCCRAFPRFPSQLPIGQQRRQQAWLLQLISSHQRHRPITKDVSLFTTIHDFIWLLLGWSLELLALRESQQFMTQRKTAKLLSESFYGSLTPFKLSQCRNQLTARRKSLNLPQNIRESINICIIYS